MQNLVAGMSIHEFMCITLLNPNCSLAGTLGIDFNDSTNPANLEIISSKGNSFYLTKCYKFVHNCLNLIIN